MEILVLRHDGKRIDARVLSGLRIVRPVEIQVAYVFRAREHLGETPDELVREV